MKDISNVAKYWVAHLDDALDLAPGEEFVFAKMLEIAKKSSRILEIGVGKGRMVRILKKKGTKAEFHGLDITDNVFQSDTIPRIGDARSLPYPDAVFDLAYSLGTVEHFPETLQSVKEHARVVKKGGCVIITTPHLSLFTPLRVIIYLLKDRKRGSFEEIRGRNISIRTMRRYFREANLQVVDSGCCGLFGVGKLIYKNSLFRYLSVPFQKLPFVGAYLYLIGTKE